MPPYSRHRSVRVGIATVWTCWDTCLLIAERLARQVYWNAAWLRSLVRHCRRRKSSPPSIRRSELKRHLQHLGVTPGALVMVHTSVSGFRLAEQPAATAGAGTFLAAASHLVDDLLELVGEAGTLVMPAHPQYQTENDYAWPDDREPPTRYDPATTPCCVGLANELFWRRQGVLRSLHPYNTLAAYGPLAAELLRDNLNRGKPLPHGSDSAYYRFCRHNGLVVSIGIPLGRCLTLVHVAEEVRDQQWPIKDFFGERRYLVHVDGRDEEFVVRQHRPEYPMLCLCLRKVRRDLVAAGILHETTVENVRVDWARAGEVLDYMMSRNHRSPYPYYGTWLVRRRHGS